MLSNLMHTQPLMFQQQAKVNEKGNGFKYNSLMSPLRGESRLVLDVGMIPQFRH